MTRPYSPHTKIIKGHTKKELLDSCLRHEANGWECIVPMHEVNHFSKQYDVKPISTTRSNSNFTVAADIHTKEYRCVYKYKGR